MSNNRNLGNIATAITNATSGQVLTSQGSGVATFADAGGGVTYYANVSDLPSSENSNGDAAFVGANNRLYVFNGAGWYSVALLNQTPTISSVADAGSNTTPFTLSSGTATVITITATDTDGDTLTYDYSVSSGALNGSTVTKNNNVFTVTPHASNAATFNLTFTVTDGVNTATSAAQEFTLAFSVLDSNHTTLLATAVGTSDNNNITDSSSNSHSITVNGDTHAGTFSPHRSGGYAMSFNGTDESFEPNHSSAGGLGTTWSVSYWANIPSTGATNGAPYIFDFDRQYGSGNGFALQANLSFKTFSLTTSNLGAIINTATSLTCFDKWSYYVITHSSGTTTFYIDGSSVGSSTASAMANVSAANVQQLVIGADRYAVSSYHTKMDVRDFHVRSAAHNGAVNNEPAVADSNTVILAAHKPYLAAQTGASTALAPVINNSVSTKPFSPYDYNEYAVADNGGSVYFDGSNDSLQTSTGKIPTSGSFTVSAWAYSTRSSNSTKGAVFGQGIGGQSGRTGLFINSNTFEFHCEAGDTDSGVTALRNVWFFLELQVTPTTAKLFINGVEEASKYLSGFSAGNYDLYIGDLGSSWNTTFHFYGYISDFLVQAGTPSGSSTVPTAPRSSSGTSLHIKGTDASIIDKSQGANLKLIGTTTGSTTQVKFANTKSMYFDGNSDYITIADDEAYGFGTGDWTIETWLYCTKTGGFNAIFDTRVGTGTQTGSFGMGMYTTGKVQLYASGFHYYPQGGSDTLSFNTWQHLAVVKNSGTTTMYFNGIAASTTYSDSRDYGSSQPVQIGKDDTTSNYFGGYMQDFRITKGLARYTASDETANIPSAPLKG